MSSFLEQSTIQKGGSCIILGNNYQSFPWTNHLSDFLLSKALNNKRYSKVIILLLDRNKNELFSQSQINETLDDKIIIMYNFEKFIEFFNSTLLDSKENICIFINSISSLIYQLSISEIKKFLSLISRFTNLRQKGDISSQSLIVSTLNANLHSEKIVDLIRSFFLTSIFIKPNVGTMSKEVAAEILTVRKANSTNKMSENIELFKFQNFVLSPISIHPVINQNDEDTGNIENGSNIKPLVIDDPKNIENLAKPLQVNNHNFNTRLITFDSTDPEFDEDSDPDADLDL